MSVKTKTGKGRKPTPASKTESVSDDGAEVAPDSWNFRLYVAGDSPKSMSALANLKRLCDVHLDRKYRIEVVDLTKRPELAKADQILAVPTLVRKIPEPMKRIIGDLSNAERALLALEFGAGKKAP
jgi:circadian clock protein KaiB